MNSRNTLHSPEAAATASGPAANDLSLVEYVEQALTAPQRGPARFPSYLARRALEEACRAEKRLAEQQQHIAYLEQLASTDPLTGLLNRRGFQEAFQHALAEARRYGEHGVLVCIDLDGFKPVNDTYGHAAGDEMLRQLARVLTQSVRDTDYVGRMGGDEFTILLTRTARKDGLARAQHLDRLINDTRITWEGRTLGLSASLGVHAYTPADDGQAILRRADDALYKTKRRRATAGVARVDASCG